MPTPIFAHFSIPCPFSPTIPPHEMIKSNSTYPIVYFPLQPPPGRGALGQRASRPLRQRRDRHRLRTTAPIGAPLAGRIAACCDRKENGVGAGKRNIIATPFRSPGRMLASRPASLWPRTDGHAPRQALRRHQLKNQSLNSMMSDASTSAPYTSFQPDSSFQSGTS